MTPEEDRPTPWMSDYGGIEADIRQLRDFADRLQAEVERNYAPHLSYIADDMKAKIPNPADAFVELVQFLQAHNETQQATATMVWSVGGATDRLAAAAGRIATKYADTDAFSAARVSDVERALADPGVVVPTRPTPTLPDPTGPGSAPGPGPVVLP
ncbi:hypothetical protein ACH4OY_08950 [Micromonospora rubida]|uniref:ESX-1 secretion-associated protein n=1 Tax=Micromonospora rubida TaxID=2697657 RepID=A0ABW7SGJ2_9ACTN